MAGGIAVQHIGQLLGAVIEIPGIRAVGQHLLVQRIVVVIVPMGMMPLLIPEIDEAACIVIIIIVGMGRRIQCIKGAVIMIVVTQRLGRHIGVGGGDGLRHRAVAIILCLVAPRVIALRSEASIIVIVQADTRGRHRRCRARDIRRGDALRQVGDGIILHGRLRVAAIRRGKRAAYRIDAIADIRIVVARMRIIIRRHRRRTRIIERIGIAQHIAASLRRMPAPIRELGLQVDVEIRDILLGFTGRISIPADAQHIAVIAVVRRALAHRRTVAIVR